MSDKKKPSSHPKKSGGKTDKVKPPKKVDRLAARLDKIEEENSEKLRHLEAENETLRSKIADLEMRLEPGDENSESKPEPEPTDQKQKCCAGWIDFFPPSKGPLSTKQAAGLGILAAIILGLTLFLTVRGFQWSNALNALRSEPGIEIFGVERRGLLGKRLIGLHDPLAPDVGEILKKHNVNPDKVELLLTEYHSLNTPYEKQRKENDSENNERLRDSLLEIVRNFTSTSMKRHGEDLEKMTRLILEARFPEEMETVELRFEDGIWHFEGGLFEPVYSLFKSEAPAFLIRGTPHWDNLVDLTNAETSVLRENIESINLFQKDPDGGFVHLPRLQRLIRDYDAVCDASKIPTPRLQIELRGESMGSFAADVRKIQDILVSGGKIPAGRFLPTASKPESQEKTVAAHLKLITLGSTQ